MSFLILIPTGIAKYVISAILNNMDKSKSFVKHIKIIDETIKISDKKGNGFLKVSVSKDNKGRLSRYSLTYSNPRHFNHDNGRILGYDNCHGKHHRHYMGKEESFEFKGYEEMAEQFEKEWRVIHEKIKTTKNS